jgi:hypothetical protein
MEDLKERRQFGVALSRAREVADLSRYDLVVCLREIDQDFGAADIRASATFTDYVKAIDRVFEIHAALEQIWSVVENLDPGAGAGDRQLAIVHETYTHYGAYADSVMLEHATVELLAVATESGLEAWLLENRPDLGSRPLVELDNRLTALTHVLAPGLAACEQLAPWIEWARHQRHVRWNDSANEVLLVPSANAGQELRGDPHRRHSRPLVGEGESLEQAVARYNGERQARKDARLPRRRIRWEKQDRQPPEPR